MRISNEMAFGRRAFVSLMLALSLIAMSGAPASANSKYAGIVIDANNGNVLYADHADAPRYPASLTKMMTLYMVFEAIEAGRIRKDTRIPISANAAREQPSKVGFKPGASITVEQAILALVTKSANDVATAVGEFLGGSEAGFAKMTTARARALGMTSTTFRNAHGLPNSGQRTTARDMARLGIALREHFPQHYHYFSVRSATVAGKRFGNHNKLLGRVKGVDGIKTGYIRASGFNLVSSVNSGGRNIVAVVMGGRTGRSRDDHMADLIQRYLGKASRRSEGPLIAARRTIAPQGAVAAGATIVLPRNVPVPELRPADMQTTQSVAAYAAAPDIERRISGAFRGQASAPRPQAEVTAVEIGEGDLDIVETSTTPTSGWVVQVASSGSEHEARTVLAHTASSAADVLGGATPFTEPFSKDGVNYVRARFGGFASKDAAWNACDALKRRSISCYAVER